MSGLYQEDLQYVYDKLIAHPLFVIDASKKLEFDVLFASMRKQATGYDAFIASINRLTGYFCDGHTNMEMPYSNDDKALNIPCYWDNEKLLLSESYMGLAQGSQITAIEDKTINEMVSLMADRIPHENLFLVKSRMVHYPYKNYHVFSGDSLESLFGAKDAYSITFVSNGREIEKSIKLERYNGYLDFSDNNFIYYELVGDTAVLHLDSCICDEQYKNVLRDLVEICDRNGISTLVLDLSKNMGGSSAVIDEFIKYTDVHEYRRYEMIDYSRGEAERITKRTEIVRNEPYAKCFHLDIHCRVSHDTFSSARTFAVTLKDNGIATRILGMPTGGKPSSFGMPQRFKTPNYSIPFRVSRCLFLRPDSAADEQIALYPDQ